MSKVGPAYTWACAGALFAALAAPAWAGPPVPDAATPDAASLAAELRARAERVLPDADDTAVIVDLASGARVLEHHPEVARRARVAPGSVLKVFTAYALLEAGLEQLEHRCTGRHTDALGVQRDCWDRRGHGSMRLRTAIAASCNVWFYEATSRLRADDVLRAWRRFGIPSAGGEGVLADEIPAPIDPRDLPDLAVGDHRSLGLTARSLLDATARLATRDPTGGLDAGPLELIAHGMEEAVRSGTLAGTFAGLDVAAKSGTGPRVRGGVRGLVIGWTPAARPRFAFVIVKGRGRGARDAGPPARELVSALARAAR